MSGRMKIAIGGIIIGLILLFINPWIGLVVIAAAIAVPVGAYLMLDPVPAAAAEEHPGSQEADPLRRGCPAGSAQQAGVEQRELIRVAGDQP